MNGKAQANGHLVNDEEIFDTLFSSSMSDTGSQAGWLELNMGKGEKVLKTRNINIKQINKLNERLQPYMNGQGNGKRVVNITNLTEEGIGNGSLPGFQSLAVFSLKSNQVDLGRLHLLKDAEGGYDEQTINKVNTYVSQSNMAFQHNYLLRETLKAEAVNEEMAMAKQIQQRLIPSRFPANDMYDIYAYLDTSKQVGGDFYDYFQISESKLAIVIGDVSGKGLPAALYMAEMKGIFQSLAPFNLSPNELMARINTAVGACFARNTFVTMTLMIIDTEMRKLRYVRAGHCPVLYYSAANQQAAYLQDKGLGLGIVRDGNYEHQIEVQERSFSPGDIVVLYTDGLTEAQCSKSNEEYGYERLKESLVNASNTDAEATGKHLLKDFKKYVKQHEGLDDVALITMHFC